MSWLVEILYVDRMCTETIALVFLTRNPGITPSPSLVTLKKIVFFFTIWHGKLTSKLT